MILTGVNRVLSNLIIRVDTSWYDVCGTNMKARLICSGGGCPPALTWESGSIRAHRFIHCCVDLGGPVLPLCHVCIGAEIPSRTWIIRRLIPELEIVNLVLLILDRGQSHALSNIDAVIPEIQCRHESCSIREVIPALVLDMSVASPVHRVLSWAAESIYTYNIQVQKLSGTHRQLRLSCVLDHPQKH